MSKRWSVVALAAGVLVGMLTAVPASAAPTADRTTYETTIELLDRAAAADSVARAAGGWSVWSRFGSASSAGRWECCAALRRARQVWAPAAAASQSPVIEYGVDLRRGRYQGAVEGVPRLVGTPTRVFARLERTDGLPAALRVAGNPAARWLSGSAVETIPNLVPGDLYADAVARMLPSMIVADLVGMPTNVNRLERHDTPAGTTYRGSIRRYGSLFAMGFTFEGTQLTTATVRHRGTSLVAYNWHYERPAVVLPSRDVAIGARTLRAAYGYSRFPAVTRAVAADIRKYVKYEQKAGRGFSDADARQLIREGLRFLGVQNQGPMGIVIKYRYRPLTHGGRLSVRNRFGHRSRTVVWDAARQRVRVSRVR